VTRDYPARRTPPALRSATVPAELFAWRDSRGVFHAIDQMETRHLFYTLRMIWNHSVPEYAETRSPHQRYRFGRWYTPERMGEAVRWMMPELRERTDLEPEWRQDLLWMQSWLDRRDVPEDFLAAALLPRPMMRLE